jgi:hypothetical protein
MPGSRFAAFAACLGLLVSASSLAQAATLIGLTADGQLVTIDTAALKASDPRPISGSPQRVLGIDRRASNGQLYGLAADGSIVTIDPDSGKATGVSKLSQAVDLGSRPVVDFNPVADRLRVIARDGVSLRIDVDTGAVIVDKPLAFDASEADAGKRPMVLAGAYTNSVKGSKSTELLHIEALTESLVLQSPPNDGVLKMRGKLGMKPAANATMDIWSSAEGSNMAFMIADGTIYSIDLGKGSVAKVGAVAGLKGDLADIVIIAP